MLTKYDLSELRIKTRRYAAPEPALSLRLPDKQEFFRVNPDPEYVESLNLVEDKQARRVYIVHPDLDDLLIDDSFEAELHLAVNRNNEFFIIYTKYPRWEGESSATTRTNCVEKAQKQWIRMLYNHSVSGYEAIVATGKLPDPVWPATSFSDLVNSLPAGTIIDSEDHPMVLKLLGMV